jgi:hypothetical protein
VLESGRLELTQEGAPCRFQVDTTLLPIPSAGGVAQIQVVAMAGCDWTARAVESWITIVGGASGSGNGAVEIAIAANAGAARQGAVSVAGNSVLVAQQAVGSPP